MISYNTSSLKDTRNFTKNEITKSPRFPGIYIFLNKKKKPLYIGKAKILKNRLISYFSTHLFGKTLNLVGKTKYFTTITVNSEIEALILEAKLIKLFKPVYNISQKDDKQPLYIVITKEIYPRIIAARNIQNKNNLQNYYGPFPSSKNVYTVLSILRKIIPFSTHKLSNRSCVYSQMGLCNPCPSYIESLKIENKRKYLKKDYLRNINTIKNILNGNTSKINKILIGNIIYYSKLLNFEKALYYKNILDSLNYITTPVNNTDSYISNPNFINDIRNKQLDDLTNLIKKYFVLENKIKRIECYDISHISGKFTSASMVTFIEGLPDKSLYRRFKILHRSKTDDYSSLREVAERRKKHIADWGLPDLMIIDGGIGQIKQFIDHYKNLNIPVIGIEKRYETLVIPYKNNFIKLNLNRDNLTLIINIRNEAHRFAKKYHKKLLDMAYSKTIYNL